MNNTSHAIRSGTYLDSVVLMQLQRGLLALPDVLDAGVVMATPANRDLLAANNLLPAGIVCSADDLLIVVKANSAKAADSALGQVDSLLAQRRHVDGQDYRPHSLASAVDLIPEAGIVLISIPGRYAASVAKQALDSKSHVFLYSDNVSIEDELSLKEKARDNGLLVMGPDCGTAILNGIGLGFANRLRRGNIGIVGASGTGMQAISSQIDALGAGISQAIGTGSRDLSEKIGAITTLQALDLMGHDPETQVIVLVSKPPSAEVATRVLATANELGKPVIVDFIGYPPPGRRMGNLVFATSLDETAHLAVEQLASIGTEGAESQPKQSNDKLPERRYIRGLFSGGTLAYETMLGLQPLFTPLYSNAPINKNQLLNDPLHSQANTILDLGDEYFMVGRLHPMIDNDLRIRRLRQEAADPQTGWILLDVVLGEGSHPDPASELAPVIHEIKTDKDLTVLVTLVGTESDPQNMQSQREKLETAGALVFQSLSQMLTYLQAQLPRSETFERTPVNLNRIKTLSAAINVGLESFYTSLIGQGVQTVQVDWRPPAGGDERLADLLAKMKN
jgi:FdrA protein